MSSTAPLAITGGVMMGIGVLTGLLLQLLFGADHRQMRRVRHGPRVTAQVVGMVEHDGEEDPIYGGGGGGFAPILSFRSVDGEEVRANGQYVFDGSPRRVPPVGATMQVHYDPRDPRKIFIRGWDGAARGISVLLVIGPVVMFIGLVMVVSAFVAG